MKKSGLIAVFATMALLLGGCTVDPEPSGSGTVFNADGTTVSEADSAEDRPASFDCGIEGCTIEGEHTHEDDHHEEEHPASSDCGVEGCTIEGEHTHEDDHHEEEHKEEEHHGNHHD